jgi:hypothetical protein
MKNSLIILSFLIPAFAFAQLQNGVTYKIKNVNSGRYAQTGYASRDNGATIHLFDNREDAHFKWKAIDVGAGLFKFQNVNSGKFLAVAGASKDNYGIICQWDDIAQQDILWQLASKGNGYNVKNIHSGKMLAVEGGSRDNGAKLSQPLVLRIHKPTPPLTYHQPAA